MKKRALETYDEVMAYLTEKFNTFAQEFQLQPEELEKAKAECLDGLDIGYVLDSELEFSTPDADELFVGELYDCVQGFSQLNKSKENNENNQNDKETESINSIKIEDLKNTILESVNEANKSIFDRIKRLEMKSSIATKFKEKKSNDLIHENAELIQKKYDEHFQKYDEEIKEIKDVVLDLATTTGELIKALNVPAGEVNEIPLKKDEKQKASFKNIFASALRNNQ